MGKPTAKSNGKGSENVLILKNFHRYVYTE